MIAPMTIPEVILLEALQSALKFVRTDYAAQSDKTKSYLYKLMNGVAIEKYGLFEQAAGVICTTGDYPKEFVIDLMFNIKSDRVPVAHIMLPTETTSPGNGIGVDVGYADIDYEDQDDNPPGQEENLNEDHSREVFSRRIKATYDIVIVSDNTNEVVLLYHFIRSLLIALIPHLHLKRLQNISFGGQDLQPYPELANILYMRAVRVSLEYDLFVPSIFSTEMINELEVDGTPTNG
jgi:hypothetical protein